MAVRVPAGECTVRFNYRTPGLLYGMAGTCVGVILLCVYLVTTTLLRRRQPQKVSADTADQTPIMAYLDTLGELPPPEENGGENT
jgi:hypothetical protein